MTHHDSLDRDLPAWLADDAVRQVPPGLLDSIAAGTRTRRQQPAWLVALRGESMGTVGSGTSRALRLVLVVVLVAVAVSTGLLVAGMLPTQPQHESPLAFIRDGDVYLAAGDGSQVRLVLHQDGVEFATVAWSPAGDKLALSGDSGVVVFDIGRALATAIDGYGYGPAWSPDGQALAVIDESAGGGALRILDAESLATRATYPFGGVGGLAWSPDGRWIATTGGGDRSNAVIRIDVTTGDVVQIAAGSGHLDSDKQVSWSPDSRHIAYIRYGEAEPGAESLPPGCHDSLMCRTDVFVADADGANAVRVNPLPGQADAPAWSPDGTWLAFRETSVDGPAGFGIHVVRPDGTEEQTIISISVAGYRWSPEGDRIVFVRWDALTPAVLWEASLTGEGRSLDLPVDRSFLGGTGLSFDLLATGP